MTTIRMMLLFTVLLGVVYPLTITGVASWLFPHQAKGSLIVRGGKVAGSELIGQSFESPRYFWSRPSATPSFAYNSSLSSGSNLGPKNPARQEAMENRRRMLVALDPGNPAPVPLDLLQASGSGLDPHISPDAAAYQRPRVARLRGVPEDEVARLAAACTEGPDFGLLGEPRVNVLRLNLLLDQRFPLR